MKEYIYLGVNDSYECCIIKSVVELNKENAEELINSGYCKLDSTNWGGYDDVARTIRINNFSVSKDYITLNNPCYYDGYNRDWGQPIGFCFKFNKVYKVFEDNNEESN